MRNLYKILSLALAAVMVLAALSACTSTEKPADKPTEQQTEEPTEQQTEQPAGNDDGQMSILPAAEEVKPRMADGERFDSTIILEGYEEAVKYEHAVNESMGIEIDYEYESLSRASSADCERFISVWDLNGSPENYLEIRYSPYDAETALQKVVAAVSQDYDVTPSAYELDYVGEIKRVDVSEIKGTGMMADQLSMIYVIPAENGSIIATAHYSIEAAEGYGHRFAYIMRTISLLPAKGEKLISDDGALTAVKRCCLTGNADLQSIVKSGDYPVYWEISDSGDASVTVVMRSYTGALTYYRIDRATGETAVSELVPGVIDAETPTGETFNAWDYLF